MRRSSASAVFLITTGGQHDTQVFFPFENGGFSRASLQTEDENTHTLTIYSSQVVITHNFYNVLTAYGNGNFYYPEELEDEN